jgi:hypothetical protein
MRLLLAILCVASSLTLVALGGSYPTCGFHHHTLSFGKSHDVEGASYEESGGA